MKTVWQMLRLTCHHPHLSRPMTTTGEQQARICADCGYRVPHSYILTDTDKQCHVEPYVMVERSISQVSVPWWKGRKRA